jgi:hypothetical protein
MFAFICELCEDNELELVLDDLLTEDDREESRRKG